MVSAVHYGCPRVVDAHRESGLCLVRVFIEAFSVLLYPLLPTVGLDVRCSVVRMMFHVLLRFEPPCSEVRGSFSYSLQVEFVRYTDVLLNILIRGPNNRRMTLQPETARQQ